MLAAMADLRATGHRIPRSLGPFDSGACGHIYKSFRICSAIRLAGPIPYAKKKLKVTGDQVLAVFATTEPAPRRGDQFPAAARLYLARRVFH